MDILLTIRFMNTFRRMNRHSVKRKTANTHRLQGQEVLGLIPGLTIHCHYLVAVNFLLLWRGYVTVLEGCDYWYALNTEGTETTLQYFFYVTKSWTSFHNSMKPLGKQCQHASCIIKTMYYFSSVSRRTSTNSNDTGILCPTLLVFDTTNCKCTLHRVCILQRNGKIINILRKS